MLQRGQLPCVPFRHARLRRLGDDTTLLRRRRRHHVLERRQEALLRRLQRRDETIFGLLHFIFPLSAKGGNLRRQGAQGLARGLFVVDNTNVGTTAILVVAVCIPTDCHVTNVHHVDIDLIRCIILTVVLFLKGCLDGRKHLVQLMKLRFGNGNGNGGASALFVLLQRQEKERTDC